MNIRQFESQYAALKVLSVNRKMGAEEIFLTFKKRQNIVTANNPASWAEIVHFMRDDLVNAFVTDFLEDARHYNDSELEKMFLLFEHNQELFKIKELARDFLMLALELTQREDSGWGTQIEDALCSRNMVRNLENGIPCLKMPFANLMTAKVKHAFDNLLYSTHYTIFTEWLPRLKDSQPAAIANVRMELEKMRDKANLRSGEVKKLYAIYNILL